MLDIVSPLDGIRSPFGQGDQWAAYKAGAFIPAVVADFKRNRYRGTGVTGHDNLLTHTCAGNATMVDSDGKLKWAPHNLVLGSNSFTNVFWAVDNIGGLTPTVTDNYAVAPDGTMTAARVILNKTGGTLARIWQGFVLSGLPSALYTDRIWMRTTAGGTSNVGFRINADGVNCVVTGAWQLFSVALSAPGTSAALQVLLFDSIVGNDETADILIWGAHAFRSDLGGMVNNPDTGDSYVPTTTAARYLSRRGHHKWNGSAWVNKGLLLESEARTNLALWSNDLTNGAHFKDAITVGAMSGVGPDGATSLGLLTVPASTANHRIYNFTAYTVTTGAIHSFSRYLRQGTQRYVSLLAWRSNTNWSCAVVDLQTGTVTQQTNGAGSGTISLAGVVDCGGGLWQAYLSSAQAGTQLFCVVQAHNSGTPTLDANGGTQSYLGAGETFTCGFCMDELGSTPSSPIPTTTAAVTRAAETLTIPAARMAYSAVAMSFAIKGEANFVDGGLNPEITPWRWYASATEYMRDVIRTDGANTGQGALQAFFATAEDQSAGSTTGYTPGLNVALNEAARLTTTAIQGATKGTAATADSALGDANMPAVSGTALDIGHLFMGTIETFRQWPVDIQAAGLVEAST